MCVCVYDTGENFIGVISYQRTTMMFAVCSVIHHLRLEFVLSRSWMFFNTALSRGQKNFDPGPAHPSTSVGLFMPWMVASTHTHTDTRRERESNPLTSTIQHLEAWQIRGRNETSGLTPTTGNSVAMVIRLKHWKEWHNHLQAGNRFRLVPAMLLCKLFILGVWGGGVFSSSLNKTLLFLHRDDVVNLDLYGRLRERHWMPIRYVGCLHMRCMAGETVQLFYPVGFGNGCRSFEVSHTRTHTQTHTHTHTMCLLRCGNISTDWKWDYWSSIEVRC